jgi:hypothetical protein
MSNPIIREIGKLDQSQLNDFVQGRVQASCFEINNDTSFEFFAGATVSNTSRGFRRRRIR